MPDNSNSFSKLILPPVVYNIANPMTALVTNVFNIHHNPCAGEPSAIMDGHLGKGSGYYIEQGTNLLSCRRTHDSFINFKAC